MPRFFHYVRDRDLWHWHLPDSKAISLVYWAIPKDWLSLAQFAQDLDEAEGYHTLVTQGEAMQQYAEALVQEQAARSTWGILGGYHVPIVNTTTLFSEVGEALCRLHEESAFAAYFFLRADGKKQWGLRGHGKVDLSVLAKEYGGGGHPNSAGFTSGGDWMPPQETPDAP
jgi:nanoRNase/pAp phosphatase (c-di-AMP/oligoRNAs hydrolase)